MPSQEVGRLAIRIEATAKAERQIEKLILHAQPTLRSETRARRRGADGNVLYDVVCDDQAGLDRLLFEVEKVRGAAVHQCV